MNHESHPGAALFRGNEKGDRCAAASRGDQKDYWSLTYLAIIQPYWPS